MKRIAVSLLALLVATSSAFGEATAHAQIEEGKQLYVDEKYPEAYAAFREGLKAMPPGDPERAAVLFRVAKAAEKLMYHCVSADHYRQYLKLTRDRDSNGTAEQQSERGRRRNEAHDKLKVEGTSCERETSASPAQVLAESPPPTSDPSPVPALAAAGEEAAPAGQEILVEPAESPGLRWHPNDPREARLAEFGPLEIDEQPRSDARAEDDLANHAPPPSSEVPAAPSAPSDSPTRLSVGIAAVAMILAGGAGIVLAAQANDEARGATSRGELEDAVLKGKIEQGVGWGLLSLGAAIGLYALSPKFGASQGDP